MRTFVLSFTIAVTLTASAIATESIPRSWQKAWPNTDFANPSVALSEFTSGGPAKDGIRSIDHATFRTVVADDFSNHDPFISAHHLGVAKAYPLSVLLRHEIVNDTISALPISVTYCPLCNSSVVYVRRVAGRVTTFGTTGMLRNSDLVMYDRATESWWQQFTGEALLGERVGTKLEIVPARVESLAQFARRHPRGLVMIVNVKGDIYQSTPYPGYDRSKRPFLFRGDYVGPVPAMTRVVAIGAEAWSLPLVAKSKEINSGNIRITYVGGQNSPLDRPKISRSRDIGNVIVERKEGGIWIDVPYDVPFAFAFLAFHPGGIIYH